MPSLEMDRVSKSPKSESSKDPSFPSTSATPLRPYSDQDELVEILRTQSTFTRMAADVRKLASRVRLALAEDTNDPASSEFRKSLEKLNEPRSAGDLVPVTPVVVALFGPMAAGKFFAIMLFMRLQHLYSQKEQTR